ncbi:anthrax toxin-like adenylyl cyclase domain-containing protein [Spiroplasma endosymbiont of Dactylopius coccus]
MEIYINKNVETCENNGVLEKHFQGFVKTAQEENVVIILRPVNPITKYLLPQKYPTKSSSIKNKSSDWGIQSGFIVALDELAFLSKIGLKDNETQTEKINLLCKNLFGIF